MEQPLLTDHGREELSNGSTDFGVRCGAWNERLCLLLPFVMTGLRGEKEQKDIYPQWAFGPRIALSPAGARQAVDPSEDDPFLCLARVCLFFIAFAGSSRNRRKPHHHQRSGGPARRLLRNDEPCRMKGRCKADRDDPVWEKFAWLTIVGLNI